MGLHSIVEPSLNDFPVIHTEPSRSSPTRNIVIAAGDPIDVPGSPEDTQDWVRVAFRLLSTAEPVTGWLETRFLGAALAVDQSVPPVSEEIFVRACAREEMKASSGQGEGVPGVVADYLIALALIESKLTDFGANFDGSDAIGPFRITSAEWEDYRAAFGAAPPHSSGSRLLALPQIAGAAYLTQRDYDRFSELETATLASGGGAAGPFVPSFLNMFHARLLGVEAAYDVFQIQRARAVNPAIDTVLARHIVHSDALAHLMKNRRRYLLDNGTPETVEGFVNRTAGILSEALKRAFGLLVKHFPEFVPKPVGSAGSWMAVAERELAEWSAGQFIETDVPGRAKVATYFSATDYKPNGVEAWCGAFIAYCLREAGMPAADSIVRGSARAVHWKTWGNLELRQRDRKDIPEGAIVLLTPDPSTTNSSGHVGFFKGVVEHSSKISLLGGNQSNRVKISTFDLNRIVAVRWLDAGDPSAAATDVTPITGVTPSGAVGATERDVLILAGTLYGEARGEAIGGREAVASVVLNRSKSGRYPSSVEKVCLQPAQFSCWNANDPNRARIEKNIAGPMDALFLECVEIAERALKGVITDVTGGALHYHATSIAPPSWVRKSPKARVTARIGGHIFYDGIS